MKNVEFCLISEENELLKLDLLTEHQLNKTNDKGETVLHQAAMKSENEAVIERLCRRVSGILFKNRDKFPLF